MYTHVCKSYETQPVTQMWLKGMHTQCRTPTCTCQYAQTLNIDQYYVCNGCVFDDCIVVKM